MLVFWQQHATSMVTWIQGNVNTRATKAGGVSEFLLGRKLSTQTAANEEYIKGFPIQSNTSGILLKKGICSKSMEKLLLKGLTPKEGSERECRNRGVIITITVNCNALHFHIFTVIQNTAPCRTGSDYLNTQCTVSPLHKCLEVTRVYMKWSYWYFSTAVTAHQEGRDNTNQGMEFSQSCSVKRL